MSEEMKSNENHNTDNEPLIEFQINQRLEEARRIGIVIDRCVNGNLRDPLKKYFESKGPWGEILGTNFEGRGIIQGDYEGSGVINEENMYKVMRVMLEMAIATADCVNSPETRNRMEKPLENRTVSIDETDSALRELYGALSPIKSLIFEDDKIDQGKFRDIFETARISKGEGRESVLNMKIEELSDWARKLITNSARNIDSDRDKIRDLMLGSLKL